MSGLRASADAARWRLATWLLNHPSKLSWMTVELFRPNWGGWPQKFRNVWWQARHYGDEEAFHALYLTYRRSLDHRVPEAPKALRNAPKDTSSPGGAPSGGDGRG